MVPFESIRPPNRQRSDIKANDQSEASLVRAAAEGSEEAFAELLGPYRSRLFGYLMRSVGSHDSAEDLLQETLIRCWRGLSRFRERGRFAAWLFTIARNVVHDDGRERVRRRSVFADVPLEAVREPGVAAAAPAAIESQQLLAEVDAILQTLPEARRQVFLLRQHGGLTFREIAEELDQPLGTVLSHMHRAMNELKRGFSNDAS